MGTDHGIVWETASESYALLIDLKKGEGGRVSLGASREFQKEGVIRLYCQKDGRRELLKTLKITGLEPRPAGEPVAFLTGFCTDRKHAEITVKSGGRTYCREAVTIPRFARPAGRFKPKYLLFALPLLAAGLVFLFLSLPGQDAPGTKRQNAPYVGSAVPAGETPAAPKPPDSRNTPQPGNSTQPAANLPPAADNTQPAANLTPAADNTQPAANLPPAANNTQPAANLTPAPAKEVPFQPVTVYFMPEMAEITPEARKKLEELAETLAGRDLRGLEILGHCALFGTESSRVELSQKRAENTAAFLARQGLVIPEGAVIGQGGSNPATQDPRRQELNRRVEIRWNPRQP